ncbi:c-type cytochrome [Pedobacter yulinensis]|uniref:Photosynthetic reaction center cytochrome c subunit n=1 Tax=Pedobacter yulinensis TaxID=2126353 RepID=A0A2T3HNE1_9SPHI|nr:c-type cytochrome [Pedobacter yulinensis]PST83965.1 c-type cytochrome [Pedobacter yulinensis]
MSYRKILIFSAVAGMIFTMSGFMPKEESGFKNLKVLPKNISKENLGRVMDEFKVALGVRCSFCHAPSKTDPKKMDFASDENKHKDVARNMMRMTARINKKYFHKDLKAGDLPQVTCMTCHNGKKEPARPGGS